jgi:ABC-type antimicrobial peptide transport system, permease component
LIPQIRKLLSDNGKSIVMHVETMDGFMRDALFEQRVTAQLTGALGILGMVLAAFGLYGVIAFLVGRRTREIGVRMALGAPRTAIFRLILAHGLRLSLMGVAIGSLGALTLGRLLGSMLYGVGARDPAVRVRGRAADRGGVCRDDSSGSTRHSHRANGSAPIRIGQRALSILCGTRATRPRSVQQRCLVLCPLPNVLCLTLLSDSGHWCPISEQALSRF